MNKLELLAPAKNAEFGKAAINHGADAIYIGAPKFGARAAAGNSLADIADLIRYAHLYNSRVYATINTILHDNELEEAFKIINELYASGIDALIIQDMGLLELNLPPVPLIASTQTNNATVEKVVFLEKCGFKRIILARELNLTEIIDIRQKTTVELEFFIHGALCTSFSGQCYLSQAITGRSSNRGVCAQPCRSGYDLIDASSKLIVRKKHLLSLKDLNLSGHLEGLIDAGITSFKIEGRLKDLAYVKNVTAFYRQKLDAIILGNSQLKKTSSGVCTYFFQPDPEKSFNRGFTDYFIEGRKEKTGSPDTQKSLGKKCGVVTGVRKNQIEINGEEFHNADGICYFDARQELQGFLINKVEGNVIFPDQPTDVRIGTVLYRNFDHHFNSLLSKESAIRKIGVKFSISETEDGFCLQAVDEDGITVEYVEKTEKIIAQNTEAATKQIREQLSKSGESPYVITAIDINLQQTYFFKHQTLNLMRREALQSLTEKRVESYKPQKQNFVPNDFPYPSKELDFTGNVLNSNAKLFYQRHGVENILPAFESIAQPSGTVVMTTKHCIKYQFDLCRTFQNPTTTVKEPLFLKDQNRSLRLAFDCKKCEMKVMI
jgi:23S rRNA 5-hydroxycytidine C2501 synthase